jgi:DNA repair protein RecN (Recombination protein N)
VVEQCSESDSGNVLNALTASLNRLSSVNSSIGALGEASSLLTSAQIQVEEAVGELNRFLDNFDADPARLQYLEERLDAIYTMARKHRIQPTEVAEMQQRLLDEIETLNANDESIERLGDELASYARHYQERARELSDLRHQASSSLASAVEQEIQRLGMPGGRFTIELRPNSGGDLLPNGLEQVELLVSANPGQPLKALAKVASGGELSRISLAIQVITAQTSRVPTLVFEDRRADRRDCRPVAAPPGRARAGADGDSLATSGGPGASASICAQGARRESDPHGRLQAEQK